MKSDKSDIKTKTIYIAAMLLGALCFTAVYGTRILNPCYTDWLLNRGDLTQHYLGWCFFRESGWTFPIGLTDRLVYPDYSSVIYTDSIPLFAVFFKLLSPFLPESFQYFGWWGLACFVLQGLFAAKILNAFHVGKGQILIGSIIFILSPVVIEKMFRHTTLGGHWIILFSIYLFARHRDIYTDIKKTMLYWGLTGAYTGSVHMYFLPMCGAFLCGFVLCSWLKEKRFSLKYALPVASFAACLSAAAYLLGAFSTRAEAPSSDLGAFSFNLNGFFNAKGYSKFLPSLAMYRDGQYEGFAYLGLGVLFLIAAEAVYTVVCRRKAARIAIRIAYRKGKWKPDRDFVIYGAMYVLMSAGLILFAASPEVTFGDRLLFVLTDSSTLTHYWSIFRSSGRVVWPVCYLIMTGAIVCNDRLFQKRHAAMIVLAVCAFVQIFDISGKLIGQRNAFAGEAVYESPLQGDIWERLSKKGGFEHIIWVSHNIDNNGIMHIAKYAYDNGLTMNNYYFARGINVNENTRKSLENPDKSCIYIFRGDETDGMEAYGLHIYEAGEYFVGTAEKID